jgi:hypothetical protein
MSKSKVHVIIPYTTSSACGASHMGQNGSTRECITCKACRKTEQFKKLPSRKNVKQIA